MSFRDPLVVLRPYPAPIPDTTVVQAVEMAAAVASRVSAIACGISPKVPRSIFGDAVFDVSGLVGEEKQKSALDVRRLLSTFSDVVKRKGLLLGEQISDMRPSEEVQDVLSDHARLYDLTIVPMPEGEAVSQFDAQWYVEEIVFGSGRPTIVVPAASGRSVAVDTVAVAWDKSRTAARAIADAMPVLRAAKRVVLLTVIGEKEIVSERSGDEFVRHLALQGVSAMARQVDAGDRMIGEVLRQEVAALGCDLIVMGAYGRSRIREFILGGATKAMLTQPPTALFMSH